jgi:pimeloyl-ACP methyl ester carboxylesterase
MLAVDRNAPAQEDRVTRTIVLIHGAWMTPLCWEGFVRRYEARGYRVIAPAWPYDDRPVAELRRSPAPELARVGFAELTDHYARIVESLAEPPIIIGHSMGGLVAQQLLDRGLGSVGVAIDPAPPRGDSGRSSGHVGGPPDDPGLGQLAQGSADVVPALRLELLPHPRADEQLAAYQRQVVPTPGRLYWQLLFGRATPASTFGIPNALRC